MRRHGYLPPADATESYEWIMFTALQCWLCCFDFLTLELMLCGLGSFFLQECVCCDCAFSIFMFLESFEPGRTLFFFFPSSSSSSLCVWLELKSERLRSSHRSDTFAFALDFFNFFVAPALGVKLERGTWASLRGARHSLWIKLIYNKQTTNPTHLQWENYKAYYY